MRTLAALFLAAVAASALAELKTEVKHTTGAGTVTVSAVGNSKSGTMYYTTFTLTKSDDTVSSVGITATWSGNIGGEMKNYTSYEGYGDNGYGQNNIDGSHEIMFVNTGYSVTDISTSAAVSRGPWHYEYSTTVNYDADRCSVDFGDPVYGAKSKITVKLEPGWALDDIGVTYESISGERTTERKTATQFSYTVDNDHQRTWIVVNCCQAHGTVTARPKNATYGTVDATPDSFDGVPGAGVTSHMTAEANSGYYFSHWDDEVSGRYVGNSAEFDFSFNLPAAYQTTNFYFHGYFFPDTGTPLYKYSSGTNFVIIRDGVPVLAH